MKKLFFLSAIIVTMSACSLLRTPAVLTSTVLDYSVYQKQGFFISESNSVNFEYTPIGSVSALNLAGYKVTGKGEKVYSDDAFGTQSSKEYTATTSEYVAASQSAVLEEIVKKSKASGANAIINLKIRYFYQNDGKTSTAGYEGTAMAIKK